MNKLDNILKQQMETFAPDAPNIWVGIEQSVQANAAVQTATISKTIASKLFFSIAKIAAIIVIPASVLVYFVSNEKNKIEKILKVESNILSKNQNTVEIKTEESLKIASVNTENKLFIISEPTSEISNNSNSNSLDKIAKEIVSSNKLNIFGQIIVSNESNKTILKEEIAESKEVEMIEENETKGEVYAAENAVGIKSLPNCFTPDNDGINDKYVIDLDGEKFYNLKIYNYNNELVFESNDKNNNWDGVNYKTGQACNSGIYYGIFEFKLTNEDKISTRMTKIKLIR